jgi:hypothetical protein
MHKYSIAAVLLAAGMMLVANVWANSGSNNSNGSSHHNTEDSG